MDRLTYLMIFIYTKFDYQDKRNCSKFKYVQTIRRVYFDNVNDNNGSISDFRKFLV